MVIESNQLSLIIKTLAFRNNIRYITDENFMTHAFELVLYTKSNNYSLFAGQKVFTDAEEILSILSEAFDKTFLKRKGKERGGYNYTVKQEAPIHNANLIVLNIVTSIKHVSDIIILVLSWLETLLLSQLSK